VTKKKRSAKQRALFLLRFHLFFPADATLVWF